MTISAEEVASFCEIVMRHVLSEMTRYEDHAQRKVRHMQRYGSHRVKVCIKRLRRVYLHDVLLLQAYTRTSLYQRIIHNAKRY